MVQIIPAILATSEEQYRVDLAKLERSNTLQNGWVHIDLADNIFVQNKTIKPEIVQKFPTNLRKEAHLMVKHPFKIVSQLVEQKFDRIIIHLESESSQHPLRWTDGLHSNLDFIEDHGLHVRREGIESGLAIKLGTPLDWLFPYLSDINVLLIMGIEPGFQGSEFDIRALDRIKQMVKIRQDKGLNFQIGVDGGIKDHNIKKVVKAGADYVVVGSYLLKGDLEENLETLWEAFNG